MAEWEQAPFMLISVLAEKPKFALWTCCNDFQTAIALYAFLVYIE